MKKMLSLDRNLDTAWIDNFIIIPQNGVGNVEKEGWTSLLLVQKDVVISRQNRQIWTYEYRCRDTYGCPNFLGQLLMDQHLIVSADMERTEMKFDLAGIDK